MRSASRTGLAIPLLSSALLFAQAPAQNALEPKLDFPMSMKLSTDGKFALVLSAGERSAITVVTTSAPQREVSRVDLPDAWLGLAIAPGGKTVYAGGAARGSVYEFTFSPTGELKLTREMKASTFVGDVAVSPDGRLIYAADLFANQIVVINPQSGRVIDTFRTGRRPYRILFHPDGKSYFVSSWADSTVYQYTTINGEEIGRIRLGPHTTDMVLSDYKPVDEAGQDQAPWKYRLFVAAANTNNVFVVGIGENKTMTLVDNITAAPPPASFSSVTPLGMTPSALALSPDQKRLYVACSDADSVASVDVSDTRAALQGFITAGKYPTAVQITGTHVLIANGRANSLNIAEAEAFRSLPVSKTAPVRASGIEHVVYAMRSSNPEELMRAVAGLAPDFTVKLGRRMNFDLGDPANGPPAGYLWTNAISAGITVRNYGVFAKNGQFMDPALKPISKLHAADLIEDLKQFETNGTMPRLILVQLDAPEAESLRSITEAIEKSRFGSKTKIVTNGDLAAVETFLGLRPMTRLDAVRP